MTILERIMRRKRERVEELKRERPVEELIEQIQSVDISQSRNRFLRAIKRQREQSIKIIAEIKRASPIKGVLREFKVEDLAQTYVNAGADAISVITEEDFFLGSADYISLIRQRHPEIPILRKDFIFDAYQVYETKWLGADALLLIASILDDSTAKELFELAENLGLDVLFEVHDKEELLRAIKIGFPIIGINNRNLKTMEISLENTLKLKPLIPQEKIVVSESGIKEFSQVEKLLQVGVDAILVGTSLVLSDNPQNLLLSLKGRMSKKA